MEIEVDFNGGVPLIEQISRQVISWIESGELQPGDQLPTTRQLAVRLGVNFNTVARAYRLLDQSGIISTQPGRGTFVLDPKEGKPPRIESEQRVQELARYYIRQAAYLGFSREEIQDWVARVIQEKRENDR